MKSTALCAVLLTGICLNSRGAGVEKQAPLAPRPSAVERLNMEKPAALGGIRVFEQSRPRIEAIPSLPAAMPSARLAFEEGPGETPDLYKKALENSDAAAVPAGQQGQGEPPAEQSKQASGVPFGEGGAPQEAVPAVPAAAAPLDKVYPKVVVILDTFHGPASASVVKYTEKLLDIGVHVVFVTPRAEKGENSAESVLVSQLRPRAGNPVMVVSYNGARITAHKPTRSENPKPVVDDQEGFAPNTIAAFRAINAEVAKKYAIRGTLSDLASPADENAYLYRVDIPKSRAKVVPEIVKDYNERLKNAGLDYRVQAVGQADGSTSLQTQSTALRLNTGRIFGAIVAQHPDLRDRLKQEDVFLFADSTRATRFLKSLPGKDVIPGQGYGIQGVTNQTELENGLFAVLHGKGLDDVKVTRQQLRAFIDWLAARERFGSPRSGGGFRMGANNERYNREVKFYRGIILYHLMGELYHRIRSHNFDEASLSAALDTLDAMWRDPKKFGININEELEGMRGAKRWKFFADQSKGVVRQWLTNYYDRNFKDYPRGLSEQVVGTMINLARDSGNQIKLAYESQITRRRYNVGVLPARGQVEKDENGDYILVGHAYRTGKELRQDDFEESLEVNLLQKAMLEGYAKRDKETGRWTVNGRPVRVMVIFHTMTRELPSDIMTPEQIDARSGEVMALIEKMLSDKEFLEYWAAEQAKNSKVAAGAATAREKSAARPKPAGKKGKKTS